MTYFRIPLIFIIIALFASFGVASAQTELNLVTWFLPGALDPLVEAFEAENPDIKVIVTPVAGPRQSFESVLVRTAGGAPPDLAMVQHGEHFLAMSNDVFLDLAPYIEREIDLSQYLPEIVRYWNKNQMVGGPGQVVFPLVAYTGVFYFNNDLFQQAGLVNPIVLHQQDAWSREAFEEAARKITRKMPGGELDTVGFTMIPDWIDGTFIHNAGGRYYNEDATRALITEPAFVDAVQWLADLVHVHEIAVIDEWDHPWFTTGRAGMMHNAAWMMDMLSDTDVDYDIAPMFYTGMHRPHNSPSGDGIAISKSTPHPEEAWRFVRFMTSPEGLKHFEAGVPVHRDAAQNFGWGEERNMAAFIYETAEKMQSFYPPGIPESAGSLIAEANNRVYGGDVSAQVALSEVASAVDAALREWHEGQ